MAQLRHAELVQALQAAGVAWKAAQTHVAALDEEQQRALLGAVPSERVRLAVARAAPMSVIAAFPPAVDWRHNNGNHVSPVKDQGGCGSCVSFACAAVIESMADIERGLSLDLSEADSHFCSSHGPDCSGWWPDQCLDQIRGRGVCDEDCFPYAAAFPGGDIWSGPPTCSPCADRDARSVRVTARAELLDPVAVKNHLSAHGPVAGCLDVFQDFFSYGGGIYTHVTGPLMGGHCVQVIGYSDPDQCWIVKNSWRTTWGMNGFGKIAYRDFLFNGRFFPMYGVNGVVPPSSDKDRLR